jgi:hypothetical protein
MKEVDLGKHIISFLEKSNYKIYQEVDCKSRGIDIVGVSTKDTHTIAVELKLTFNIKLIEQAYNNRSYCHYSYLAVPSAKHNNSRRFAIEVCRDYGIGIIEYVKSTGQTRELVKPSRNNNPETITIFEDKASYSEAGSPDGKRWTPFKQTCVHINEHLSKNPGITINELVKNINHHYANPNSAKTTIRNRIKAGIIKNVKIIDNKLYMDNGNQQ